jgi:hypothetical protein
MAEIKRCQEEVPRLAEVFASFVPVGVTEDGATIVGLPPDNSYEHAERVQRRRVAMRIVPP